MVKKEEKETIKKKKKDTIVDERGSGGKIPGHIIINKKDIPEAKWYVVHTMSGHEARVAETLRQRIESMGFEDNVLELLLPTQDRVVIRGGKKATIKEKIFPGYLIVKMVMNDAAWLTVRTTPSIRNGATTRLVVQGMSK